MNSSPTPPRGSSWGWLRPRTWKGWTIYGVALLVIVAALSGGGEDDAKKQATSPANDRAETNAATEQRRELARERQRLRAERLRLERVQARRALQRRVARAQRERARALRALEARRVRARERRRQVAAERRREQEAALAAEPEPQAASCHPSYDPCLDPNASDYDCEGGSGDGPEYTGFVTVTGPDDYDLDSDDDGTGCES